MTKQVFQELASLVAARLNCIKSGNDYRAIHEDRIAFIVAEFLPSGSGIDSGVTIDLDKSTGEKLVFNTAFHHMDDNGSYDHWTEHTITVTPSFIDGFNVKVSGLNWKQIKDYLAETFDCALRDVSVVPCEQCQRNVHVIGLRSYAVEHVVSYPVACEHERITVAR